MTNLVYFCVEGSKGTKAMDKRSDQLYIEKLLEAYFKDQFPKCEFSFMGGKNNYKKAYNQALQMCEGFKKDKVIDKYVIILVLDKDKFTSYKPDIEFIKSVDNFQSCTDVKVIWFTMDIEHVLHGARTKSGKTQKAQKYKVLSKDKEELKKRLGCTVPNSARTSNFIIVLNELKNEFSE